MKTWRVITNDGIVIADGMTVEMATAQLKKGTMLQEDEPTVLELFDELMTKYFGIDSDAAGLTEQDVYDWIRGATNIEEAVFCYGEKYGLDRVDLWPG